MKKIIIIILVITLSSCAQKTTFDTIALNETFTNMAGEQVAFKDILAVHKGKTILIDIWASWCGDCIKDMPKMHELQQKEPEVVYIKLSVDKNMSAWQRGIKNFKVTGEHYLINKGWKTSDFCNSLRTNWIPRYLIVGKDGTIKMYKATKITSSKIKRIINKDKM